MPRLLTGIAVLAAFVLLGASSTMNYMFASSVGRTPFEGVVLGVVAVGIDVLKTVLAVVLAVAAQERRWGFFCIGGGAFVLFSVMSLTASFGFSASNRSAVFGEREHQNGKLAAIEVRRGELRAKLKTLSTYRPLPVVEEAMAVARSQANWAASKQCTAVTKVAREFCEAFGRLRTERATAIEGDRLDGLLAAQDLEAEQLRRHGSGLASDPQAKALAGSIGLDEVQVQRGLIALMAVVIEVASGLGMYLALGVGTSRKERQTKTDSGPAKLQPATGLEPEPNPMPAGPTDEVAARAQTPRVAEPRAGVAIGVRAPANTRATAARRNGVSLGSRPMPDDRSNVSKDVTSNGHGRRDKAPEH